MVLLANSPHGDGGVVGRALGEKGYECVTVDTLLSDPEQKFVGVNNRLGIEIGMDHLTSLGHRSIALLVNEPEASENIQERIATFQAYHRNNGLRMDSKVFHTGTNIWENSAAAALTVMEAIWNTTPRPTAIFAVSDLGAIAAIQWLQKRENQSPRVTSPCWASMGPTSAP